MTSGTPFEHATSISHRQVLDALPQPVWVARGDGIVEYGNRAWRQLLGEARGSGNAIDWLSLVHADDRPQSARACSAAIAGAAQLPISLRMQCGDGQYTALLVMLVALDETLPPSPALPRRVVATAHAIAAATTLAHPEDLSSDDLRAYVRHVETAIEQERAHIARELHDELGQRLTALKFDLHWLAAQSAGHGTPPASWSKRIQDMNELVDRTIVDVRALSSELRPPAIEMLGLAAAIEDFCRQFGARTGIACRLELQPHKYVRPAQKLAVFRVFQEAMTNIARHSGARRVTVRLYAEDRSVCLEIVDDGHGPSAQASQREHLGVLGMRERAHNLGGTLEFAAAAEGGVRVLLTLPLTTEPPIP